MKNTVLLMSSPPAPACTTFAKAAWNSRSLAAFTIRICRPIARAASSRSRDWISTSGPFGSRNTPMIDALGTNSSNIPSSLATNGTTEKTTPVILPPGRLMLGTRPTLTGVGSNDEYDRRRRGCGFACLRRRNAGPYDRGNLPAQKVGSQSWQSIFLIVRPAILDGDVFAFDESSIIQALTKGIDNIREASSRSASEKSDHRHRRLLRARRERPRGRAPEQRDELATLHLRGHSITSS